MKLKNPLIRPRLWDWTLALSHMQQHVCRNNRTVWVWKCFVASVCTTAAASLKNLSRSQFAIFISFLVHSHSAVQGCELCLHSCWDICGSECWKILQERAQFTKTWSALIHKCDYLNRRSETYFVLILDNTIQMVIQITKSQPDTDDQNRF